MMSGFETAAEKNVPGFGKEAILSPFFDGRVIPTPSLPLF
jgi:hypothetical protein